MRASPASPRCCPRSRGWRAPRRRGAPASRRPPPGPRAPSRSTESRWIVKASSVSSPAGDTAWRWRSIATAARLGAHGDRRGGQHPSLAAPARRAGVAAASSAGTASKGSASATASSPPGSRWRAPRWRASHRARRRRRAAGRPAWGRSPAGSGVRGRTSARPPAWQSTRSPGRGPAGQARPSSGSASIAATACPRPARSSATRPVPAPTSSTGLPRPRGQLAPEGRSAP